ncbi:hypothetical protein ACFP1Z_25110 [Streptomyces gamaensis]|uniref:Lipoprotein n=1 Tax=Streptomyces gamaensis TaxID=1763542 RepID=A0ABW0Z692_9ACTN
MARKYGVVVAAACASVAAMVGVTACGGGGGATKAVEKGADTTGAKSGAGASPSQPAKPRNELQGLSAKEISEKAKQAMLSASSVRMKADITMEENGKPQAMKMDLALDTKGNCTGTISAEGAQLQVIGMGEKFWMKPDEAYFKNMGPEGEAVGELFKGRYLHGTVEDGDLKEFAEMCNLAVVRKQFTEEAGSGGRWTKGELTTLDGQSALPLANNEGKTVHVAATGKPYLLKMSKTGEEAGTMTFTDWDKPVTVTAPAESESIDVSKLGKLAGGGTAGTPTRGREKV